MLKIRESDKRRCGGMYEGFGEYRTFWPDYEYRCPVCGTWHKNCEISQVHDDGTESYLCEVCSAESEIDIVQQ